MRQAYRTALVTGLQRDGGELRPAGVVKVLPRAVLRQLARLTGWR